MPMLPQLLDPRIPHEQARRIVGVGQKMYLTYRETEAWLRDARARADKLADIDLFVLPSFPALALASTILADTGIRTGAQDMHWQERGPFTGAVSALSLLDVGCTFVEIGHAERRALFGETDDIVRLKTAAALRHGLAPVICVGEEHEIPVDMAIAYVLGQVEAALDTSAYIGAPAPAVVIAYEPVWAIGQAASAPVAHVRAVVGALRQLMADTWQGPHAILYGGSVQAVEAAGFVEAGADGVFVGRAALDLDNLYAIVAAVATARR